LATFGNKAKANPLVATHSKKTSSQKLAMADLAKLEEHLATRSYIEGLVYLFSERSSLDPLDRCFRALLSRATLAISV
jgi:hypothetical protein